MSHFYSLLSEELQTPGSLGTNLISGKIVLRVFIIGVIAAPRDPSWDWESSALAIGKGDE